MWMTGCGGFYKPSKNIFPESPLIAWWTEMPTGCSLHDRTLQSRESWTGLWAATSNFDLGPPNLLNLPFYFSSYNVVLHRNHF